MPTPNRAGISEIKSFVTAQRWGMLSTLSASRDGYPFGSLVPYDIDMGGNIFLYVSLIAEHYKNLGADCRASLTVLDPFGISDPQAHARATILLDFETVSESERGKVQHAHEARFPNSINYEIAHNFLFMKGRPRGVRWIGGFGDIQWIDKEAFSAATPDILSYEAWPILSHMNQDHQEALCDFISAQTGSKAAAENPRMVALNSRAFTIRYGREAQQDMEIAFASPVQQPEAVRSIMIETLKAARAKIAARSS